MTKQELSQSRTKCRIYSRIVGYYAAVDNFNDAQKEMFGMRKTYDKQLTQFN